MNEFVMPILPTPLEERLERRRVTTTMQLPKREFLFAIHNTPCFPRGELVAVTGKAKSGKTFISSILMAASLSGEAVGVRRSGEERYKVVWIDTEQSEESTQDILLGRIYPLAGNCPEIDDYIEVFNLRADNWQERLPLVETAVTAIRPDMVIFDGVRDVVNDINDGKQAQEVVERLMRLAGLTMSCIVCVLHQNKAIEDNTLRGALGTELQNKCFECYECKKDPDTLLFSLKQNLTRKYDLRDEYSYSVNKNGLPQAALTAPSGASNASTNPRQLNPKYTDETGRLRVKELFEEVVKEDEVVVVGEAIARLKAVANIYSDRFAQQVCNEALAAGYIEPAPGCTPSYKRKARPQPYACTQLNIPLQGGMC